MAENDMNRQNNPGASQNMAGGQGEGQAGRQNPSQGYGDEVGQGGGMRQSGTSGAMAGGSSGAMGSDLAEQIREDMEVVDASGNRVGTVDRCEDGQIKLTRADSPDGQHRFIPLDQVENVEGGTVMIRGSADEAFGRSGY